MVNSSYLNFYNKKEKKFLNSGKIKVKVLPPFQTQGMTLDSVNQLSKHLHELMQREFHLLNKEIGLEEKYYSKEWTCTPEPAQPHHKKRNATGDMSVNNMSMNSNLSEEYQRLLDGDGSVLSKELNLSNQSSDSNEYDYGDDALVAAAALATEETKKSN